MNKNSSKTHTTVGRLPESLAGTNLSISSCYQCKKCSAGCPLTFAMDLLPDQVIRLALLGQTKQVLESDTIWVCSSCETCTARCPNGVDIAGAMDFFKENALKQGLTPSQPGVAKFHQTFLTTVRLGGGRLSEPLLLGLHLLTSGETLKKIKSGEIGADLSLGWELARRGRLLPKVPRRLRGFKEVNNFFKKTV